jgi:hypothetical protein
MEVSQDPRVQAVPIRGEGLLNRHMLGCMERRRSLRLIQAFFELAPMRGLVPEQDATIKPLRT